jgi:hypothetical protein
MPIGQSEGIADDFSPPIKVRLTADEKGNLEEISLPERSFGTSFDSLNSFIATVAGPDQGPAAANTEVDLDCDYDLKYDHVVQAITAVSGKRVGDRTVKFVDKLKFSPPRKPAG